MHREHQNDQNIFINLNQIKAMQSDATRFYKIFEKHRCNFDLINIKYGQ
jgi:hypothetical protein